MQSSVFSQIELELLIPGKLVEKRSVVKGKTKIQVCMVNNLVLPVVSFDVKE